MVTKPGLRTLLRRLWPHIGLRRRIQLGLLFLLMLGVSLSEMISIGALVPFLAVLSAPETVMGHAFVGPFVGVLGAESAEDMLLPLTLAFVFAIVLAATLRVLLLWANTRLSFAIGADISNRIYRCTLHQPYAVHLSRNSSEVISGISDKADGVVRSVITPLLAIANSVLVGSMVLLALLIIDPVMATMVLVGMALIYQLVVRLTKQRLIKNGRTIATEYTRVIKTIQETLGGIRDILIDGVQNLYCRNFREADYQLRRAQGENLFLAQSPRYLVEALGMLLIAWLAFFQVRLASGTAIPVLGAMAFGAQKLLPALQQAYAGWSALRGGQESLTDVLALLEQALPAHADEAATQAMPFERSIRLRDVAFRYGLEAPWVLRNINLEITRGQRIGIVGVTGSGKSTLLDIIMALTPPTSGTLEIDGIPVTESGQRAWQRHIAHVSQSIFLLDASIEENIAFGVPKECIDQQRVRQAAGAARIQEFIETLPQRYETPTGERGMRLSGGQRQRIGIARALYKQADVIIFDEATSALDLATEQEVIEAIGALGKSLTMFIVAHRLGVLASCDKIVELADGRVRRVSSYADMVRFGPGIMPDKAASDQ